MLKVKDLEEYVDGSGDPGLLSSEQWDLDAVRDDLLRERPDVTLDDLLADPPDWDIRAKLTVLLRLHMRMVVTGTASVTWEDEPAKGDDARIMLVEYGVSFGDEDGSYTGVLGESFTVRHGPLDHTKGQLDEARISRIMSGDLYDRGWDHANPWVTKGGVWMFSATERLTLTCESDPRLAARSVASRPLTALQAHYWHGGLLDARALSDIARVRLGAHVGDVVTLRLGPEYPTYGWADRGSELYRLEVGRERDATPIDADCPFIACGWRPAEDQAEPVPDIGLGFIGDDRSTMRVAGR